MQILPNFPAKSQYIFEQIFLDTFINYLMEINLTNKRIERTKTCNIMKIKLKKEMSETC